jgi:hypothetical protein
LWQEGVVGATRFAMRLRRVVRGVMDDGLWSWWEEMREQARNLTEELRFGARPPIGVTSWQNGRLKVNFGLSKWKK